MRGSLIRRGSADTVVACWPTASGLPVRSKIVPRRAGIWTTSRCCDDPSLAIARYSDNTRIPGSIARIYTDFPWEHHQFNQFPVTVRTQLEHARNFSELFHGAALLYNLMLAQAKKVEKEIHNYSGRLEKWAENITARHNFLINWDRAAFWEIVARANQRVPHLTRAFVDNWIDLVLSPKDLFRIRNSQPVRLLVQERERQLKKNLARLSNHRSLELWNGEAGTRPIDYRWSNAQIIVKDILEAVASA